MATNKQELSSDDLALVQREMYNVQDRWYDIGLCLRMNSASLEGIQNANPRSGVCLRVMLNERINQGGLTWEKIADALDDITVNRQVVAKEIRAKYCTPERACAVTRVAPDHPTAPPIPSTKPVIPTAGPSYPINSLAGLFRAVNNTPPVNTKVSSTHVQLAL